MIISIMTTTALFCLDRREHRDKYISLERAPTTFINTEVDEVTET
jgi:hypothetical protein